jgi:predicted ATPase
MLGYPDQALQRNREALTLAQELSQSLSLAYALNSSGMFHLFRRERQTTQERAESAITLSTEQGIPQFLAFGIVMRGWALTEQGQVEEGIAQLHQGIAAAQAPGGVLLRPYWLALLAETYEKAGQVGEGLTVLAEALALVDDNGERWYEAELYRLKGELLLQQSQGNSSEAEVCFYKAIDVARRQEAKSWELRATASLARLWQKQGKLDAARTMLAHVYNWFTEGFDTKDLQEAKALLEELSH